MKYLLIISTLLLLFCSCTTTYQSTAKTFDIKGNGIVQYPVTADLRVDETKIEGVSSGNATNLEQLKRDAIAYALNESDADVLIEPIFSTRTENGKSRVTVRGFGGHYKNFRKVTHEDVPFLSMYTSDNTVTETYEPQVEKANNKKWYLVLGAGLLGIASLLAL